MSEEKELEARMKFINGNKTLGQKLLNDAHKIKTVVLGIEEKLGDGSYKFDFFTGGEPLAIRGMIMSLMVEIQMGIMKGYERQQGK